MKLFEGFIEQRLRFYLEDIGFFDKYHSGFRKTRSTDDCLSGLSQSVMESFSICEHAVAVFLDVQKLFDSVWHNALRYKIFILNFPTQMIPWLSEFLVAQVIQVSVNGFVFDKISPDAVVPKLRFCSLSITPFIGALTVYLLTK